MLAARRVEELADAGQFFDDGLVRGNFAIEHAQRIVDGAALAVDTHLPDDWFERLAEGFVVNGAIVGTADRVQFQLPVFNAEPVEERGQQFENFSVARRRLAARAGRTDDLRLDLIELPVSSPLRALEAQL